MDPLFRLVVTFAAILALGGVWFGLQALIRRYFPSMAAATGEDPFRTRFGCGGCHGAECGHETDGAAC